MYIKMIYPKYLNTCPNIFLYFLANSKKLIHGIIMNYHITNVIYVISGNSLGQMQTRMEFLLLFKYYFIKKLLTKENQMILP